MPYKKNIVRILISFFGLFFILALLFTLFFKPIIGSTLIDIEGFSNEEDVDFKTAGKERFYYEKTYEMTDVEFSILNENRDMGVFVYRVPGYYYEVEFNGVTVGKVSDTQHKGSNIWNSGYVFIIDHNSIQEENELCIRGEAASSFNEKMFKVYLGRYDKVSKIFTIQKVLFQYFLLVSMGFLIALGIAITLIKASDNYGENGYIWMAIGAILFSLYLLDYIEFWSMPISKLFFRKSTIFLLFSGISCLGIGLGKRFKQEFLRRYSFALLLLGVIIVFVAYSFPDFKKVYSYASIALVGVQVLMLLTLVRVRKEIEFGITLSLIACLVVGTTMIDVYGMINNLGTAKMSLYSVVVLIVSILTISIYHLSDDYLLAQNNAVEREEEVTNLMAHLYHDHVSGYYNFKYLEEKDKTAESGIVTVAFSRIDALSIVKNNRGLDVSQRILIKTYQLFENVFGNYGEFFVDGEGQLIIVLPGIHTEDAYKMLEILRLKVMQSPEIKELSGALPYTITSGLATRIEDETIKELTHRANIAMLNGDGHGRNQTVVFKPRFLEDELLDKDNHHLMLNFVYTIINTIDSRDRYTSRHSEEVSKYSVMIAEELGFDAEHINVIKIGSMLHDCGKLGVSDFILNKAEPLTEDENRIVKNHPIVGYQLAKQIFSDSRILSAIKCHHERIDGLGYPEGLRGDDIPFEARIVSVADSYHAMTSSRKYGKLLSHDLAFEELKEGAGTQFDPVVVAAFERCFK
jgi:putative nucleotidyltransferase with HDIG domain